MLSPEAEARISWVISDIRSGRAEDPEKTLARLSDEEVRVCALRALQMDSRERARLIEERDHLKRRLRECRGRLHELQTDFGGRR